MTAVDVKAIDEAIRKLEELKRLASDPILAPFLRTNNNGTQAHQETPITPGTLRTAHFGLKMTIIAVCTELQNFTIKDVLRVMQERHYPFEGDDPQKSIGNVLRVLSKQGTIKVVNEASGRRPARYSM